MRKNSLPLQETAQWLATDKVTHLRDLKMHACRYLFASRFVAGKSVLDVSCGSGYGSKFLLQKGALCVVGVDIAKVALYDAKMHCDHQGLHLIQSDAQQLPFPRESFDVIVSIETIEHLRNQNAFLEECRRVLRHGGKILVSTPNRLLASPQSETPLCPYHTREFTVDDFRELLNSYFCKVTIYGMFAFGKLELLKRKLEVTASAKIPFLSRQHRRFRRLITNFGLSDYSLISLNQVRSLEDLWDHRFEPYVILDGQTFSMPETIIGVGEKPDLP